MADQLPASFIPDTPATPSASSGIQGGSTLPASFVPDTPATGGGRMNFAIVNGVRVPIEEPDPTQPMTAVRHAESIGAPSLGDRYIDKPLTTMSIMDVVRRNLFGPNAERPASVAREDPYGASAFAEGKGKMPLVGLPEAETGSGFTGFINDLRANRRHLVGRNLLSDALNIRKAGIITEPEFDTALARLGPMHTPDNPIVAVDEVAQRARTVSHDMDTHVKGIAQQFPHVNIPTEPLRDVAIAGSTNPIGGGGPGSSFVQTGRGTVLRLYPQLGHYEPILNSAGKQIGSRLVDDPVSIPDAADILTSINKQLNDRLGPQAARRVRTDMIATDPAYAALDAVAKALRKGIDEGLESQGVPGVRAFRQDQAAVIKLQQAAEKVEGKGTTLMRSTAAPPGRLKQAATDIAETTVAKQLGGKVVSRQMNRRLTLDEATKKAFELMKPAPSLSYPFIPPPAAAAAAGGGRAPNAAAGGPGAPTGGAGGAGGPLALPPVGLPAAPAAAAGLPPQPWFREGEIVPTAELTGSRSAGALPPAPPKQLGAGARFVVRPNGQVQLATKAGPQIPADNVWPRPAMAETYRAPTNDPSFVRAVKGTYAEVFKRAESPPAGEPLSAPAASGAQSGVGPSAGTAQRDAARVRLRDARAEAQRLSDDTLDTLTRRLVDAGHPDHPDAIRAKLADDLRGIEELHRDNANVDENGLTLLKAIAKAGGISIDQESAQRGEIAWLKEFRDTAPSTKKGAGDLAKRRVLDTVRGVKGVFRDEGGGSLDHVLEALKQEPWRFGHIKTINDLTAAVQKAASERPEQANALADLVYHTEREIAGRRNPGPDDDAGFDAFSKAVDDIVHDKLDTGEEQGRLPGASVAGKGGGSTSMRAPQQASGGAFDLSGPGALSKGTRVFYDESTLHGTRTMTGEITRDLGNGKYEIRRQTGGYDTKDVGEFRTKK